MNELHMDAASSTILHEISVRNHIFYIYLISIREYACIWSWLKRIRGNKSTRKDSSPICSKVERNLCLTLSQQKGLHLTTSLEFGTAQSIVAQTRNTFGVIC